MVTARIDGFASRGRRLLHWDGRRSATSRPGCSSCTASIPTDWPDRRRRDARRREPTRRIGPYLGGIRRRRDLARVDVREVLLHGLPWAQRAALDRLAPERLEVPSGHRHRVDYSTDPPVLAVKLQELFGSTDTPTVAGGAVAGRAPPAVACRATRSR